MKKVLVVFIMIFIYIIVIKEETKREDFIINKEAESEESSDKVSSKLGSGALTPPLNEAEAITSDESFQKSNDEKIESKEPSDDIESKVENSIDIPPLKLGSGALTPPLNEAEAITSDESSQKSNDEKNQYSKSYQNKSRTILRV